MKLETLKGKFPFAKESYAEKIIKIVENKIGTDVEFVYEKNKEAFKYDNVFTTSYTYQDNNSEGVSVLYSFLDTDMTNYRRAFGESLSIKFQIRIVYPTGEYICIECDKSFFTKRNEAKFDQFVIYVTRFTDGVRDDLYYLPVDEHGNIKVIYDYRKEEPMIVSADNVLSAIENGDWESIFKGAIEPQNVTIRK